MLVFYWGFFIPVKEFGGASHSLSAFKGQQSAVKRRSLISSVNQPIWTATLTPNADD
jgi:hypothetical protein